MVLQRNMWLRFVVMSQHAYLVGRLEQKVENKPALICVAMKTKRSFNMSLVCCNTHPKYIMQNQRFSANRSEFMVNAINCNNVT